jgi:HSP20 family protein
MFARIESYPSLSPLVGEIFGIGADLDSFFAGSIRSDRQFAPPLDVSEGKDELVVVAEVPGVKKDDVKISVEKGILSIQGERKENGIDGNARGLRREQRRGKFGRSVRLPFEVDAAAVSAELSDGLLKIVLPKAEQAKPRQIDIKVK